MSSFINSGTGLVLSILFVLALLLSSESNLIIAKLTIWVWCGHVVDESGTRYSFYHMVLVKFYCDVISRSL